MKQVAVYIIICLLIRITFNQKIEENEDTQILQESIKRFGPPRPLNYENCNLPGPEISTDTKLSQKNIFINNDNSGNYTLKLRRSISTFSYNNNYETGETKLNGNEKTFTIKGHFTETIVRREGGFFLRTIGFISDEKGYRSFLVDVSKITTEMKKKFRGGGGCGKRKRRSPIPPGAICSLLG